MNQFERQKKALDIGFKYWRASDANGVTCTTEQAVEFMQEMLGVEVEIKPENAARLEALAKEIGTPPIAPRARFG